MASGVRKTDDLMGAVIERFGLPDQDLRSYGPLTLAYIGDAAYEIAVRSLLVQRGNAAVNKLHKRASKLSMASRQSEMIRAIKADLTEEERAVYKRGRNAKSYTKAKHATASEYSRATGFEAVVGYLYLKGEDDRIAELIRKGIERTK